MTARVLTPEQIDRTVADALAWLRARVAPQADLQADSRAIRSGDVFVSYAVEGADSRPYVADAVQRGAAVALVQSTGIAPGAAASASGSANSDAAILEVPDLDILAGHIAGAWYGEPSRDMLMVGITGTNGKTSTSHWLANALTNAGTPCAIVGTLGTGLPGQLAHTGFTTPDAPQVHRSLATLRAAGAKAVSMEVSSHALHQGRVNGVAFDIAVFTNLTQDHLDYHKDFVAYEAAKARLFDWPGLRCAVVNRDDEAGRRLIRKLAKRVHTISYGTGRTKPGGDASLHAMAIRATATGTAFTLVSDWGHAELEVGTLGAFNVANLLAVLGVLLAAEVPFDKALSQIARLEPVNGRMQRLGGRMQADEPLVVIDYAHTPDALEKTLEALRPIATERRGRLVCMFGCGGDRDATKRAPMGAIAERLADVVVVTSDNPRTEDPRAIVDQIVGGMQQPGHARRLEDRASAILQTVRGAAGADVVLLAGKGHETTQEIMGKKRPFSDQDHARLALAARATQSRGEGE
jgi:UDP-N-acetylmuramoyl-L-alanyl-D-glutamate--2,6-diaminopimelate ligase